MRYPFFIGKQMEYFKFRDVNGHMVRLKLDEIAMVVNIGQRCEITLCGSGIVVWTTWEYGRDIQIMLDTKKW